MECEFQDQGQIDKNVEEWLCLRGSQLDRGFFSDDDKQESIQI